jgi:hypothetical protein
MHGLISLEDVFLKLCVKETRGSSNLIIGEQQLRQVTHGDCGHDNQTFLREVEDSDANSNLDAVKQVNSNNIENNYCNSLISVSGIYLIF